MISLVNYNDLMTLLDELNKSLDIASFKTKYINLLNSSKQITINEDYYVNSNSLIDDKEIEKELLRPISRRQKETYRLVFVNIKDNNIKEAIYEFIDFIVDYDKYKNKLLLSINELYLIDNILSSI